MRSDCIAPEASAAMTGIESIGPSFVSPPNKILVNPPVSSIEHGHMMAGMMASTSSISSALAHDVAGSATSQLQSSARLTTRNSENPCPGSPHTAFTSGDPQITATPPQVSTGSSLPSLPFLAGSVASIPQNSQIMNSPSTMFVPLPDTTAQGQASSQVYASTTTGSESVAPGNPSQAASDHEEDVGIPDADITMDHGEARTLEDAPIGTKIMDHKLLTLANVYDVQGMSARQAQKAPERPAITTQPEIVFAGEIHGSPVQSAIEGSSAQMLTEGTIVGQVCL